MALNIEDINELLRKKYVPERRRAVRIRHAASLCKERALWLDVKIAEEKEELEAAYRLLHDVYVEAGYMQPHPAGIRLSIYNALPHTITFVARENQKVVGTVTLIIDSPLGLPMEEIYPEEVAFLRENRPKLAEAGGLAFDRQSRYEKMFMYLNQILVAFAMFAGVTDILIAINPKHAAFYYDILLFKFLGPEKPYAKVNGAPAVAMYLNLQEVEGEVKQFYDFDVFDADLYTFFFTRNVPTIEQLEKRVSHLIMTPELLRYFFAEKTNILKEATPKQLRFVISCYPTYDFRKILSADVYRKKIVHR